MSPHTPTGPATRPPPAPRGLDADGRIAREGSLARVAPVFAPVVAAARTRAGEVFGPRLHSVYLYGSVPRGTARPGRSDLDLLLALHEEPGPADHEAAAALGRELDAAFDTVDGAGVLLFGRERLLSPAERHDLGWFLSCLCTPLAGPDLAARLPRHRPDSTLARETNGDLAEVLLRWRARLAEVADLPEPAREEALRKLCRAWSRHLVRTAFTLVMPRWGGWTSDLTISAEVFGHWYPQRARALAEAARVAHAPRPDPALLAFWLEELGPWLAAEYTARHGTKSPRP
ncbi:nucleotidyltransferase domain-containing protein [Streptomyces sp. BI20]|uniref:nucleotidyltransferase domain-containing protein n=1 Tax=Streptomyces sp. BI20 TaxID=3403460 RepID=UPI003C771C64